MILLFFGKQQTFSIKRIHYYIFDFQNFAPIVWFFDNLSLRYNLGRIFVFTKTVIITIQLFDSSVIVSLSFAQNIC